MQDETAAALGRLARPLYSFADADRIAKVSPGTAKRWVAGYSYVSPAGAKIMLPPITQRDGTPGVVSFIDLVEIIAVGGLKKAGFSPPSIRKIVLNCQDILCVQRPLATLKFKHGGRDVFVPKDGYLLEVGRRKGMQAWNDVLAPFLQDLDYAYEIAVRWWPLGRSEHIVVDPEYGFGLPCIANKGVRTEIIRERFAAKDTISEIANDFNVTPLEIERALQFELDRAA